MTALKMNSSLEQVCADAGVTLTRHELIRSLERLSGAGGYLDVTFNRSGGGVVGYHFHSVLERGLRATEQWPPDDAYLMLMAVLERRLEAATDEPTKGRIRSALDGVAGMGRELAVDVMAEVISKKMG